MEGMQVAPRLTGVDTQKPMWTATFVALTTQSRPSAWRDSPCALISACIRFHPFTRLSGFCALPELSTNWMIISMIKPLSLMNEPVKGELELILERQRLTALPMTLYMCLGRNLSLN